MTLEQWIAINRTIPYGTVEHFKHRWLKPGFIIERLVSTIPATRFRGNHLETYQPRERFTGEFVEPRFRGE